MCLVCCLPGFFGEPEGAQTRRFGENGKPLRFVFARSQFRVPSPRLLDVGQTLLEAGVPVEAAVAELAELRKQARAMASRLIAMFTDHIWDPWVKAGRPASQIPELIEKIKLLQPAPPTAVAAVVAQALDREVARTVSTRLRIRPEDRDG